MEEIVRLLLGFVRVLIIVPPLVRILILVALGGLVGLVVFSERKRAHAMTFSAFRAVLLNNQTDTLHIVARDATPPSKIRSSLRSFDTPEEVYEYVYKKYDEPVYHHVVLHLPNTPPAEFPYDKTKDHAENLANLSAQLSKV